ncbi:MAG TPA: dipeptide epimerase [Flavobacteriales bacterium]|nr:dipeptide epimerase [Flavobacteriales bacterium]
MNISIQQIEIYKLPVRLKKPFIISLGPFYYAENVLVIMRTTNGITGFGECSPFMTINGENMETGFAVGPHLAKALLGKNPLEIESCVNAMDKVIYANASIKSAFDMALYDIASQHAGVPLYKFLGGENNKVLVTDYTVSFDAAAKMADEAVNIVQNGFQIIKVKLGGEGDSDVERMRAIREAVGMEIPIRIDANQGWTSETTLGILEKLKKYTIQHCEEPIPRWDFMNLPKIKKQSPIPIMADESCCDHHDAKRLLDLNACDLLNVKMGKSGGIFKALKIISIAEKANMHIQLGGFLESRLGFTAAAHLALTSGNIVHVDFDTPLMLEQDPVEGGIVYRENGKIEVGDAVGLGAKIDEKFLNALESVVCK